MIVSLLLVACGSPTGGDSGSPFPADPPLIIGGTRPAVVVVPSNYTTDKEWPLVMLLHGYGANSTLQDGLLGLSAHAESLGFILVKPEGTTDSDGAQFWNATEECCDFEHNGVDDVAYIGGLVEEAHTLYPISRVVFVGHSNGGYMSYRMACDRPDLMDKMAILAGAVYKDEADCKGTTPMNLLHIHGTADDTVAYESDDTHAGAEESVGRWVTKAACGAPTGAGTHDYLSTADGEETSVQQWGGCADDVDIQLWTALDGDHIYLGNNAAFKDDLAGWMME